MKAVKLYEERQVWQVAKSVSGNWFSRFYILTKYGYQWSKWKLMGKIKEIERTKLEWENMNGNCFSEKAIRVYFDEPASIFYLQPKNRSNASFIRLPS